MFKDCPKKYDTDTSAERSRTVVGIRQGSSAHKVFLEELLDGGVDDIDFLLEMMMDDLKYFDTEDPRDYKSKLHLPKGRN